jgi:hypothetical protein
MPHPSVWESLAGFKATLVCTVWPAVTDSDELPAEMPTVP